ncbi:MAG: hypothetical protein WDN49_25755 [Acetobacteraceae bacterium]
MSALPPARGYFVDHNNFIEHRTSENPVIATDPPGPDEMNLSILTAIAVAMAATALYVYLKQRKPNERASSPGETEPRPVVPQTLSPSPISRPQKRDYVVISVPVEEALPELVLKPPAAWFAFISGLHVAGPYENETIADRAGKGASNVADQGRYRSPTGLAQDRQTDLQGGSVNGTLPRLGV